MKQRSQGFDLDAAIRKVPDFPRPGVLFYDITSILGSPTAFSYCVDATVERCSAQPYDAVAAVEARGFVFAGPVALRLGLPLILLRKRGKLPGRTLSRRFTLEYGEDELFVHQSDVKPGSRILLIDDLIATGGTLRAAADLLSDAGGRVAQVCCIIGLPFLHYDRLFPETPVFTLIEYAAE